MKRTTNDILKPIKSLKPSNLKSSKANKDEEPPERAVDSSVPRITNETVGAHREDVLKSARKYIYPLQHSKHRIVIITTSIIIAGVVAFFSYCTLALYKFQSYSSFLYKVTQVIPFPIARVDGHFVAYQNYYFELAHYIHYYETQQGLNFDSTAGKQQLSSYKQQALNKVIDDAYIQELAKKDQVSVSNAQVNNAITAARQENRLGESQSVFENVLRTYYGWSLNDYKRELKSQLLAQDLVSTLDTATHQRAETALQALQGGADFSTLASQDSDDTATKANGGQYGYLISENNVNVSPQVVQALFALQPGQISGIINTGYSLEIDKNISIQGGQIQAAHIVFNFQDINTYLNPLKDTQPARIYIKL
jgi:hypothetical protein